VSLANDLIKNFEPSIEAITLVPSDGGKLEVSVNDQLLYSKLKTGRHPDPGEVVQLVQKFLD